FLRFPTADSAKCPSRRTADFRSRIVQQQFAELRHRALIAEVAEPDNRIALNRLLPSPRGRAHPELLFELPVANREQRLQQRLGDLGIRRKLLMMRPVLALVLRTYD